MKALDWLFGLQGIGVKLGLDNMRRLIAAIPPPSEPPLTFHVAGTNGKGSVCACLESIASAHGLTTGLFTSPHLIHFRERIRVRGKTIGDDDLAQEIGHLRKLVQGWEPHPSFFEITLAIALSHFYKRNVDCLILETGLGGRLDATNALEPRHVSVITPIHYDHTRILGETLELIAREKAGIFRSGVPVLSAAQPPEAELALRQEAARLKAPIQFVPSPYRGPLSLAGAHQRHNAALAIAAFRAGGHPLSPEETERGLNQVQWLGRFQRIGSRQVIDGAHNVSSTSALVATWRETYGDQKATIIFGCARDKQPEDVLSLLAPIARRFIVTPIQSPRSEEPESLRPLLRGETHIAQDVRDATTIAEGFPETILFTGSLFLAGEALALLTGNPEPVPTMQ